MRLGVLASGRGSNAAAIFRAIADGRLSMEAGLLICDRPGAAVLDVAARAGVPATVVERGSAAEREQRHAAIIEELRTADIDIVALAGFAAILDDAIVHAFDGRILNIHPSLLPAFAGSVAPGPQAAALAAGVKLAGCTVHIVTSDVDAGPIVAQAAVPVLADDTVDSLSERILEAEHRLYPEVLEWFAQGRVRINQGIAAVVPETTRQSGRSD